MPLPKPIGRQAEVLALKPSGHTVVLGTAGSGKSTLAILRSAFLASPDHDAGGATLLLTFNTALVRYLEFLRKESNEPSLRRVRVENYHKFARGYLASKSKMLPNSICKGAQREGIIRKAIELSKATLPATEVLNRPFAFLADEISWIASNGIKSEEEYVNVNRVGRETARLIREQRPAVFALYRNYHDLRQQEGFRHDWDDLSTHVLEEIERDQSERMYRHLVIDEGQDFSLQMLRSLTAYVPSNGSLTFFGDAAQQLYGSGTPWKTAGFRNTKIWYFEENYRNSVQIAALAIAISEMPYYGKARADIVMPKIQAPAGPLPSVVVFDERNKELSFVARLAKQGSKTRSVGILVHNHSQINEVRSALKSESVCLLNEKEKHTYGPGIYLGTIYAGKGLEFDFVILPFCSSIDLPSEEALSAYGRDHSAERAGRLLYVGITRAKKELLLTATGAVSNLLPTDSSLYSQASL